MADSIKSVLMKRDGLTAEDAIDRIAEAREQFNLYLEAGDLEGAEQICADYFGLEPDYVMEFL
jgi:hypothetical protein|tara:strand:+ start:784 stop:972 length:189 start_codon:yes stop_codon:yes gene_type:complete